MTNARRVTLTKSQAGSAYGQRIIHQILSMSRDGELSLEEVKCLHRLLLTGPSSLPAVSFLRALTSAILDDGRISPIEAYELRLAMQRVVPKDVREQLSEFLAAIGLPPSDPSFRGGRRTTASWRDDPITERQLEFIRDLGGSAHEHMSKGEGSDIISDLLERRPATPRQQMALRFFGRTDLMNARKEEVSVWLDQLFTRDEAYERAWDLFKVDIGDDGTMRDPRVVPIGAYRKYMRRPPKGASNAQRRTRRGTRPRRTPRGSLGCGTMLLLAALAYAIGRGF